MALKPVYDKQDEIPEALREHYKEQGGKWILDTDIRAHPGATGVHTALEKEKEDLRKARERLAALEGVDPEEYKKLKAAQETAERERLTKAGEFDQLQKQMADKHAKELAAREEKLTKRERFIRKVLLENEARKALEGKVLSVELVLPHVMRQLDAVEDADTGEFRPIVLDKDGKSPRVADGQGTPMTILQLVDDMGQQEQYAPAWKGAMASGSGTPVGGGGGGVRGGTVTLTREQASNHATYQAAVKQVGGDESKVLVESASPR